MSAPKDNHAPYKAYSWHTHIFEPEKDVTLTVKGYSSQNSAISFLPLLSLSLSLSLSLWCRLSVFNRFLFELDILFRTILSCIFQPAFGCCTVKYWSQSAFSHFANGLCKFLKKKWPKLEKNERFLAYYQKLVGSKMLIPYKTGKTYFRSKKSPIYHMKLWLSELLPELTSSGFFVTPWRYINQTLSIYTIMEVYKHIHNNQTDLKRWSTYTTILY